MSADINALYIIVLIATIASMIQSYRVSRLEDRIDVLEKKVNNP